MPRWRGSRPGGSHFCLNLFHPQCVAEARIFGSVTRDDETMTKRSLLKIGAGFLLATVIVVSVAAVLLPRLLDLDNYRLQILALAQKSLNRQVSYASASFSWQYGPSFVFNGITITEKGG